MNKTRSSTKIAIGFVVLAAGLWYGWKFVSGMMVDRIKFDPIPPGNVNLVGVNTSAGYYVIVANQIAQLVRGSMGEFKPGEHNEGSDEGDKKRVPIREMLQSMQGNPQALGKFVMAMNDMTDADFPAYPEIWKAEDIQKALDGDTSLRTKLERDLNVRLDGTTVGQINKSTLEGGIVIDSPVEVEVDVGSQKHTIVARVQEQFQATLCMTVWTKLSEKSNITDSMIKGYYMDEGKRLLANPSERQDVKRALAGRIERARLNAMAEVPKRVLESAMIIVNDRLIESAEYDSYKSGDGKPMYDLILNLTDEGRQRLWQYSKRNPNAQLLVTWEGIAIAAPRMQGEIAFSKVTVKQLSDLGLVKDTVDSINSLNKEKP